MAAKWGEAWDKLLGPSELRPAAFTLSLNKGAQRLVPSAAEIQFFALWVLDPSIGLSQRPPTSPPFQGQEEWQERQGEKPHSSVFPIS